MELSKPLSYLSNDQNLQSATFRKNPHSELFEHMINKEKQRFWKSQIAKSCNEHVQKLQEKLLSQTYNTKDIATFHNYFTHKYVTICINFNNFISHAHQQNILMSIYKISSEEVR